MTKRSKQSRKPDVPGEHLIARYCEKNFVIRDPVTLEFKGIFPQAFALKEKRAERYLSASWFELFEGDMSTKFRSTVNAIRSYLLGLSSKGAIAVLKTEKVLKVGQDCGHKLRVADMRTQEKQQYIGISGMPLDNSDDELLGLLESEGCIEVREVAAIEKASIATKVEAKTPTVKTTA